MVRTVSPNARETPTRLMPMLKGVPSILAETTAASTALPQPPKQIRLRFTHEEHLIAIEALQASDPTLRRVRADEADESPNVNEPRGHDVAEIGKDLRKCISIRERRSDCFELSYKNSSQFEGVLYVGRYPKKGEAIRTAETIHASSQALTPLD